MLSESGLRLTFHEMCDKYPGPGRQPVLLYCQPLSLCSVFVHSFRDKNCDRWSETSTCNLKHRKGIGPELDAIAKSILTTIALHAPSPMSVLAAYQALAPAAPKAAVASALDAAANAPLTAVNDGDRTALIQLLVDDIVSARASQPSRLSSRGRFLVSYREPLADTAQISPRLSLRSSRWAASRLALA
jgi:hypothetical protein